MEKQADIKVKLMLIGRSMAGKTTLCQFLMNEQLKYRKTQTVQVFNHNLIDTPGEYVERRGFRGALSVTAADADVIVMVQAANDKTTFFPPGYSTNFTNKPCIGVVTKADLADEKGTADAVKILRLAGAGEVYITSSYEGTGFEAFLSALERISEEKRRKAN